ncbi:ExeM/NucH family extracellular endonuclease [Salipiger marinus]|uniref:ExeM/NucH family extracellular endonuclease n=1 Tax=Salipiger marinus TaxID=555512 RepID=UPI001E57445A|nr:ExeM/NucH family extracellular endonuclease [Salipiger manganoxidans]MCD1617520.1 ExeM/NucH family extracellular endonuclease [Salipiger manganoxidans]MEB3419672.1 ExeM/NucH family extracellular endonuclease [Salipiger manganoxidans]
MTAIFINEFHYDNVGGDTGEMIEIAGPAGTDLTGWSIVLYNGSNGASYRTVTLSGSIDDEGAGFGAVKIAESLAADSIQNGSPDAIALVDADGAVVQFLSYEGTLTAVGGPADGMTSVDVGVAETSSTDVGLSLQLTGTGTEYEDFTWAEPAAESMGGINAGQSFGGDEGAVSYAIADAQVSEGDTGTATLSFTVTRTDGAGTATLDWSTADGTATAGSDYTAASGSVSFAEGQTEATIDVTVTGDTTPEAAETLTVTLTDPSGELTISQATATGTIQNDEATLISTIQGNADTQGSNAVSGTDNMDASPLRGQTVTVEAIVVGDFQNGDADEGRSLGGFYLQEEDADADGDASTSEGLYVFDSSFGTDVQVGDKVRVTGTVTEYFGMTQLGSVSSVEVISSGNALPTAAVIDLDGDVSQAQDGGYQADLEAYEGMLVTLPATLTITEQYQLDRFNEVMLFDTNGFEQAGPDGTTIVGERPFTYSQFNTPDAEGNDAYLSEIGGRQIIYDDGLNQQNQPIGNLDGFQGYSTGTAPSMGDTVTNLTGVLDYQWAGNSASQATWRVRGTEDGQNSFDDTNPVADVIAEVAGDIKVASFNVLNFFTSIDVSGNEGIGPNLDMEGRGADSVEEYERQLEKTTTAIQGLGADVVALVEIENDFLEGGIAPGADGAQGDRGIAIAALVDSLNAAEGSDVWAWVDPGSEFVGGDAIAGGFIYRSDKVEIADGTSAAFLTDAAVDADLLAQSTVGGIFDGSGTSRAPLAVTFAALAGGEEMTVVVNHFKSKGGTGTGADLDAGDGAGSFNNQRVLAAQALDAWLDTNPTGSATPNMLLLGDLNAYASEDPIAYLTDEAGFVNVVEEFLDSSYSYLFDAMLGTLDYAMASVELFAKIVDALEWHINADEADALDYNTDFSRDPDIFDGSVPTRASDHDPVVVGIDLSEEDSPMTVSLYDGASYEGSIEATGALDVQHLASLELDGAEIAAFAEGKLYVTSSGGLQIVDIADPANPVLLSTVNFTAAGYGFATTDITSVATNGEFVAVALPAADKTEAGKVVLLDLDGNLVASYDTGALPDAVTFSPDGTKILVANEGEPVDLALDNPKGGVTVIDIAAGTDAATVTQLDFTAFDGQEDALREAGVRIFEGQSVSDDLEPEFISVSADGLTAMVTLQEANAIAVLDLTTMTFTDIVPLGGKDFSDLQADFSDRDGGMNLTTGNPVIGQFMPDAITSYTAEDGQTYYIIANEGDDRDDFMDPEESERAADVTLDADAFPDAAALQADEVLGRLNVTNAPLLNGDIDGDGDVDQLLAYGARSFSILDETGTMVFDSGDALERIIAAEFPELWDDGRSDNKGPEPEGVTVGVVGDKAYAFVGLERSNITLIFDVTNPADVSYVGSAGNAGDVSPEGTLVISAEDSPTGEALYVVTNEVSATLGIYSLDEAEPAEAPTLTITEAWVGQDGTDLTGDWFEITNTGDVAYDMSVHGALYYDDESRSAADATVIDGVSMLAPGETAIVVIGTADDAATFRDVWASETDLTDVQVAFTDGSGLGQSGDGVTLWVGNPLAGGVEADFAVIPELASGVSYDVALGEGSTVGNASGAVATEELGGSDGTEPAIASPGTVGTPAAPNFTLELLHFSDQEASTSALLDAPNLSAVLNGLRAQDVGNDGIADNTLTLSSGDAIIGSPFYAASAAVYGSAGIADIQIQNELGIQAMALGNHEFDFGPANLAGLISGEAPGTILGEDFGGTDFSYLSTNLDFSTNPELGALEVAGGQAPQGGTVTSSVVLTVDSEQTGTTELVGVVGATTPTLGRISSPGNVGVSPLPFDNTPTADQLDALAAEIQAEVDALLAANPGMDKVILMAHMQVLDIEVELAGRLSNVDVIIAGGSNTRLFDENDRPRDGDSDQGQYPIFTTDADGNPIAVVNTDGSYKYVGRLVVDFDENGHIIPESYDADVSGAYATDAEGVAELGAEDLVDAEIQQIVDEIEAEIVATQSNVFGYSDVFLNGNRTGADTGTDTDGVRSQETNLGNLTAKANLAYAQEQDNSVMVSIKNGGGIRASIGEVTVPAGGTEAVRLPNQELVDGDGNVIKAEGAISQNDISSALAFNNGLSLVSMTAAEMVAVLNHAANSGGQGAFGQFAGVEYSFDPARPEGSRVTQADIVDEDGNVLVALVRNGVTVADADLVIRAVVLNFMLPNGDGYPLDLSNPDRVDLYDLDGDGEADALRDGVATFADNGTEQDAFAEYLAANHGTVETAFDEAETGRDSDLNITNLGFARQVLRGDNGDRPVSMVTDTFDGADVLRERVVDFDNGNIQTLQWNAAGQLESTAMVTDTQKTVRTYDETGARSGVTVLQEDGRELSVTFEDGLIATRGMVDTKDVLDVASVAMQFEAGELVERVTTYDNGQVITAEFDAGMVVSTLLEDNADVFAFSSLERVYDNGVLTGATAVLDNGDMVETTYEDGAVAVTRRIDGETGDQRVTGAGSDDMISGGAGNDLMAGKGGADVFVFAAAGFGQDQIADFTLAEADQLDLTGLGIGDLDGLMAAADLTQMGNDLLLDFGADEILIKNLSQGDLDNTAFVALPMA